MKSLARRLTIVVSATALSVGLMGAASPAEAARDSSWGFKHATKDSSWGFKSAAARDSSWGFKVRAKDSSWGF